MRLITKLILKKGMEACELDSAGSERAPVLGSYGHSYSPSVSVEEKEFLH